MVGFDVAQPRTVVWPASAGVWPGRCSGPWSRLSPLRHAARGGALAAGAARRVLHHHLEPPEHVRHPRDRSSSQLPEVHPKRSLGRWIPACRTTCAAAATCSSTGPTRRCADAIRAGIEVHTGGASAMIFPSTRARRRAQALQARRDARPAGGARYAHRASPSTSRGASCSSFLPVLGACGCVHIGADRPGWRGRHRAVRPRARRDRVDAADFATIRGPRSARARRGALPRCVDEPPDVAQSTSRRYSRASSASGSSACGSAARSCSAPSILR
jgi:hypothetical protein